MSSPFVGEIRMVPFNFAPSGWAFCDGQLLPISQNTALFSLLGTYYGGNGSSNFALPNLQGSMAVDQGQSPGLSDYVVGQVGGVTTVTLGNAEIPTHSHQAEAHGGPGSSPHAVGGVWAEIRGSLYEATEDATMDPQALASIGANQPHNNLPPYLVVNFIIAMQGIFPSRS